jgi:hypothetical protein
MQKLLKQAMEATLADFIDGLRPLTAGGDGERWLANDDKALR